MCCISSTIIIDHWASDRSACSFFSSPSQQPMSGISDADKLKAFLDVCMEPPKKRLREGPTPPSAPPPFALWSKIHLPAPLDWRKQFNLDIVAAAPTPEKRRAEYSFWIFYSLCEDLGEDPEEIYKHFHELCDITPKNLKDLALLQIVAIGSGWEAWEASEGGYF